MYPVSSFVWGSARTDQSIRNKDFSIMFLEDNFFHLEILFFYQVHMFSDRTAVLRERERLG